MLWRHRHRVHALSILGHAIEEWRSPTFSWLFPTCTVQRLMDGLPLSYPHWEKGVSDVHSIAPLLPGHRSGMKAQHCHCECVRARVCASVCSGPEEKERERERERERECVCVKLHCRRTDTICFPAGARKKRELCETPKTEAL